MELNDEQPWLRCESIKRESRPGSWGYRVATNYGELALSLTVFKLKS